MVGSLTVDPAVITAQSKAYDGSIKENLVDCGLIHSLTSRPEAGLSA